MSIINPKIVIKNKGILVLRSILLVCGLSVMLSGCSDGSDDSAQLDAGNTTEEAKDTSASTTDNNNQGDTNQETEEGTAAVEESNSSNENNGGEAGSGSGEDDASNSEDSSGDGDNANGGEGGSGDGDNANGGEGGSGDGDNANGGEGDSGNGDPIDDTPADTSKLYIEFIRPDPAANSAPHIQRKNQELSGRQFQLAVYTIDDELNLQEVTTEVTWTAVDENCGGETCYTLSPEGRLVAGAVGQFSVQAEYNGLLSHEVALETPRKLETCGVEGNADKAHRTEECLHIIVGNSGDAKGKWFTEPPRPQVMSYMWYSFDNKMYNSGYTHSGLTADGGSGTNQFVQMRNDGYDQSVKDAGKPVDEGQFGQHERYCADLSAIKFNGRGNWRKATLNELTELSNMSIGTTYDWPISGYYSSGLPHQRGDARGGLHYFSMIMSSTDSVSLLPKIKTYPTCVSEP
ncbi:hypothetical protein ABS858_08810 [Vibrio neptunius]|uniref:hypothetical protein n=1 Tax=Vibrio neptunius TaxID=170651 RepID=UPI003315C8AD